MLSQVPVVLITGFLGSGKTTLIKQVLETPGLPARIGIIQNEFAPANADAQEIRQSSSGNYRLLELNNGSIFCVCLLDSFLESLHEFSQNYHPDLILIETSGLADPIAVGEIFNNPKTETPIDSTATNPPFYLKGSIAVVDARHFLSLSRFQRQLRNQVRIADQIILNKIDCVDDTSAIENQIKALNPIARLHKTTYCEANWATLLTEDIHSRRDLAPRTGPTAEPSGRPRELQSTAFRSSKQIHRHQIHEFVKQLTQQTFRAKGTVTCDDRTSHSIHCVFGDVSITPISNPEPTAKTFLVTISETLTHNDLKNLYLQHTQSPVTVTVGCEFTSHLPLTPNP